MPWRRTSDPYAIVVSEVMLQQTPVERVEARYESFITAFPGFVELAGAYFADIMGLWKGLGYNRRARNLHLLAQEVVVRHKGTLPSDEVVLSGLPGLGKATAGAVRAFAFNEPAVFVETNIRRVCIHHFFPGSESVSDRQILSVVRQILDHEHPREWYYALMDYGTWLRKRVPNPNRRSSAYKRQPSFEGSNREVRGRVIEHILALGKATRNDLLSLTGSEPERLDAILGDLVREGMIREESAIYFL